MKVKLTDKFNLEPQIEVNPKTNIPKWTGQCDVELYFNSEPHDYWIKLFLKSIHQRFQGDTPDMNIQGNQLSLSCDDSLLPDAISIIAEQIKITNGRFERWQVDKKRVEENIADHVKPIRDELERQITDLSMRWEK